MGTCPGAGLGAPTVPGCGGTIGDDARVEVTDRKETSDMVDGDGDAGVHAGTELAS